MSVWLTPDLKPFYGGTYFPPTSRWGRPGFVDILQEIARVWKAERGKVARIGRGADRAAAGARAARRRRRTMPAADALATHGGAVPAGVRSAPRRLRRRAEVSAAVRAAVPAARARADRRRRRARHGAAHAARDGARRHARSHRRRLSSLLGRRAPGACRISRRCCTTRRSSLLAYRRGGAGVRRSVLRRRRRGHAAVRAARDDRRATAASIRPRTPTASRRRRLTSRPRTRRKAPSTCGAPTRSMRLLGSDAAIVKRRFGIEPTATRRRIRSRSSRARTCCTSRDRSTTLRKQVGTAPAEVVDALNRARVAHVPGAAGASASAPRRQGAHGLERADDRARLRAWRACFEGAMTRPRRQPYLEAARRAAPFVRERMWNAGTGTLLRRYRDGHADIDALRRGLRVSHLRAARTVSGRSRSALAGVGDRRCSGGRTSCSGTRPRAAGSARRAAIRASCCG